MMRKNWVKNSEIHRREKREKLVQSQPSALVLHAWVLLLDMGPDDN